MNIKEFLDAENIKFTKMIYFMLKNENGKMDKTPLNINFNYKNFYSPHNKKFTIEDIDEFNSLEINDALYDVKKWNKRILTNDELNSRVKCYCLFLNHVDNIYCVDIDEPEIHSMDDFIMKTGLTVFEQCPWVRGKNKGIHIYIKLEGNYNIYQGTKVFKSFEGDFLKDTNCIWEDINAVVENYDIDVGIPTFDFNEDLKKLFSDKKSKDKKEKPLKEIVNLETANVEDLQSERDKIKFWIDEGVKNKIFEKFAHSSFEPWRNIAWIIQSVFRHEYYNEGLEIFKSLSRMHSSYSGDDHVTNEYNKFYSDDVKIQIKKNEQLDKLSKIKKTSGFTIGTLIYYFDMLDKDIKKSIEKKFNVQTTLNISNEKKDEDYELKRFKEKF
jgi:23S rRNA A1618 N6-methylase RlmF